MATRSGERKNQILQALAEMLQTPKGEKNHHRRARRKAGRIEAALYRHFASKAQMYEGLIGFVEESVFGLINRSARSRTAASSRPTLSRDAPVLCRKNPGMTRVLIGDALVNEDGRLATAHQPAAR